MKKRRCGAMVILLAICIPAMLLLAAFSINVVYMELTRVELRVAADASARAAGRRLALSGDMAAATAEAQEAASRNTVGGVPMIVGDEDVEFGRSTRESGVVGYNFVPATSNVNSVRVTGRRTMGSQAGAVPAIFSELLSMASFEVEQTSISTQIEMDVAIVIDRSGSMAYADDEKVPKNSYYPPASAPAGWDFGAAAPPDSRWRDMLMALDNFLMALDVTPQQENVSLTTYSDIATTDVALTPDYDSVMTALDTYTMNFHSGATNVGGGIDTGLNSLFGAGQRPWAAKVVIVLTDGIHNTGTNPVTAAINAASSGVSVHTITFSNEADEKKMQQVAGKGKGKHFHATSATQLIDVFEEVAETLPTLLTK